jgi:hypothetical protein
MEPELKTGLLSAYRRLLKPLIRILIRNGVAYTEFGEVAKATYVEVAAKDFKVPHKKMSQARIAILTGLTRKEVNRIVSEKNKGTKEPKSNLNRVTRVLTGWHTDSDFTGPYGMPLELQFENSTNHDFIELVQRYSGDMAPRAMLDELQRIHAVTETENGWYKVKTRTYLPEVDAPDSLDRLAQAVQYFIETHDHNRQEADPDKRLFERMVVADDGIKAEDLARFQSYIRDRAQLLLEDIDNWLTQLEKPDPNTDDKIINTGLGIYHYVDRDDD